MAVPELVSSSVKGTMFPDQGHPILANIVRKKTMEGAVPEPINETFNDFDGVLYNVLVDEADLNTMYVSLCMAEFPELHKYGAQVVLDDNYAGMVEGSPQPGYHLTLKINLSAPGCSQEELVGKISQLKRRLMGAPFEQCFGALNAGHAGSLPPIKIDVRAQSSGECIYIIPRLDRVVIIFSVEFAEKTDQALAKVFLAEFGDLRGVPGAPPVTFSRDPPLELKDLPNLPSAGGNLVGYISFAILKDHVSDAAKRTKAVSLIATFRNYMHYHIKAAKSYLHMRMRSRVTNLLQVLNRAVPDKDPASAQKKTMAGKTFTRK